ncbi:MAG: hypothetical protein ABIN89_28710 [Chitinophagaceae bacterium]
MNNIFRGLIAGYGAKKLGGGCFSTIIVFLVIWYALGHCGNDTSSRQVNPRNGSVIKPHVNAQVASTYHTGTNYSK